MALLLRDNVLVAEKEAVVRELLDAAASWWADRTQTVWAQRSARLGGVCFAPMAFAPVVPSVVPSSPMMILSAVRICSHTGGAIVSAYTEPCAARRRCATRSCARTRAQVRGSETLCGRAENCRLGGGRERGTDLGARHVAARGAKGLGEGAHEDVDFGRVDAPVVAHAAPGRAQRADRVRLVDVQVELCPPTRENAHENGSLRAGAGAGVGAGTGAGRGRGV